MASPSKLEKDASSYLDDAEECINKSLYLEALTILRRAQPLVKQNNDMSSSPSPDALRRYMQLQALCRIELAHASAREENSNSLEAWWHLFNLENPDPSSTLASKTTTEAATTKAAQLQNIKKQYKRLAILIHPDKCSIPIASNLFNVLQQGMEALIEHVECSEKARKKVKNDDEGEKDLSKEEEEEDDHDDEFAWWTEWDNPNTSNNDGANAASTTEEIELQQKKEKEANDDDVKFLTLMQPLEKLSEEVRARQNAMLSRPPPGKTLQDMKIALVRAKTILNTRLIKEKEVQAAASGGGFLN